ncbi:MAG: hypothetical protein JST50_03340 [Bacteroidetes bacterium]|nr:hypothetical protein [Bacteroidota bacterium]
MDSTKFDFSRSGSKTSLLIVKAQNAMNMYAMTIVADSSYLKGNYNLLANNTYQKIDTNFTGTIFFNQMDGTFVNGWIYKNGVITRQLSPASTSNGQAIQSINSDKLHVDEETPGCGAIVSVTVYEDCYTYPSGTSLCYITSDTNVAEDCPTTSGGGGSGGATGGGGGGTSPCTVPPANSSVQQVVINSTPTRGFTVNVAMPPPGGGTTTPCTETTTTQTITDNVSNPCLKGLLDNLAINNTLQTDVTSMLRNTFGTSDVINITFVDGDFTSTLGTADAGTDGLSYNNFEVKFNTPIIKDGSKEFLLETAMHEIYHAYLYANPTVKGNLTQHAYMIQNYVNAEVQTLRQVFPNLSIHDAECLVLSGYGDLDANTLNTAIASYGLTLNDVTTTNTQYKSGVSGTKCPVL